MQRLSDTTVTFLLEMDTSQENLRCLPFFVILQIVVAYLLQVASTQDVHLGHRVRYLSEFVVQAQLLENR